MFLFKNKPKQVKHPSMHAEIERKETRWVIIGFIITAILIVGFVGFGILNETVFKYMTPVAQVENEKISARDFIDRVKFQRNRLVENYKNLYNEAQNFVADQSLYTYFSDQLKSYQTSLDNTQQFGKSVLDQMVMESVIRVEAVRKNISVNDAEIDQYLQDQFGFYPNGTPTPANTPIQYPTPTYSATQIALLHYTPTPSIQPTSLATISNTPTPLVTATSASPTSGPTPTLEPTATPYTKDLFTKNVADYYTALSTDQIPQSIVREYVKSTLLQIKLQDYYAKNPEKQEQVWARHILVPTEADAKIILSRLNSGEDWSKVAASASLDTATKDNGGDLGWFARGSMVKAFEDAAFSLKIGEISAPVQTEFGWHIIQVLGHDTIPLNFSEWVTYLKTTMQVTTGTNWQTLVPTQPTIPANLIVQ